MRVFPVNRRRFLSVLLAIFLFSDFAFGKTAGQSEFVDIKSVDRSILVELQANARLSRNPGVVASFSRALTEGLTAQQSDEEFDAALDAAVSSIFAASNT